MFDDIALICECCGGTARTYRVGTGPNRLHLRGFCTGGHLIESQMTFEDIKAAWLSVHAPENLDLENFNPVIVH